MATKQVDLKKFADELGSFSEAHLKDYRNAATRAIVRSIPALVEASPVDTGLYAQSWGFTIEEWGVILGNHAPHAPIIEYGARPFTPPLAPLLAWAKRVLNDPSQPPNYSPEVWELARGTQRKIARVGMQPQHVMENAIPGILEKMRQEFAQIG